MDMSDPAVQEMLEQDKQEALARIKSVETTFTAEIQALLDSDRDNEGGCFNTGLEPGFVPVRLRGITAAFKDFDKWETYGLCFKALQSGAASLAELQSIAWREAGIKPDIIEMRMTDMTKVGGK